MAGLPPNPQTVFKQSLSPTSNLQINIKGDEPAIITSRHHDGGANDLLDAVRSKLVRDPNVSNSTRGVDDNLIMNIDNTTFNNTVKDTEMSISEARNMMDALPDLTLVKDIVISSVLSPNDMMTTELIYNLDTDLFGDVKNELIDKLKDYFETTFDINSKLGKWLEKALFTDGAMPIAVIPESSIDDAINSHLKITQESFNGKFKDGHVPHYGFLTTPNYTSKLKSPRTQVSFESFNGASANNYDPRVGGTDKLFVTVIDNPEALKIPMLNDRIRRDRIAEIYGGRQFGLESYRGGFITEDAKAGSDPYPTRQGDMTAILNIKTLDQIDRKTVGHPVVFELPMESVIPVYSPSDPSKHLCYFVALDDSGSPIRIEQNADQIRDMQQNFSNNFSGSDGAGSLMQTAKQMGIQTGDSNIDKNSINDMKNLYSRVLEQDLIARLGDSGFKGKDLKLSDATEIYQLMFVRALAQMHTQLLFIPKELMTYIAFDYKDNGVGRSLLDKTKVIGSLRMVNVITSAISNAKSAIDHRDLEIKLDPDDPDPMKRVNQYLYEFQRSTKANFPMGVNSFASISEYLQRAGVQVKVTGHEGMPDMSMDVSTTKFDYNKPDESYMEDLQKKHIMSLGAPPESINSTQEIQFATQVISSNIFFAKISLLRQKIFSGFVSEFMQIFSKNSQPLMDEFAKIIENNRDSLPKIDRKFKSMAAAIVFVNNLYVELPKPDVAQVQMQSEAYDKFSELLEKVLPAFISTELLNGANLGDKAGEAVDNLISILKAHFQRKWLMDNNAMPELFDLVNNTEEADEKFEFLSEHAKYLDSLSPNIREFLIKNLKRSKENDGVITKAEELTGEEASGYESGGSSDTGGDMGSDDGMDGGDGGESPDNDMGDNPNDGDNFGDEDQGDGGEGDDLDFKF